MNELGDHDPQRRVVDQASSYTRVRKSEKDRKSTCRFADRVAEAAIGAYRESGSTTYEQTCLAAFLLHYKDVEGNHVLEVVSWATGTKALLPKNDPGILTDGILHTGG